MYRFHVCYHKSLGAYAVCHACICRVYGEDSFSCRKTKLISQTSPLGPNVYQLVCNFGLPRSRRGFEPSQALQAPLLAFLLHYRGLCFFVFVFAFPIIRVLDQSGPWNYFATKLNKPGSCEIVCTKSGGHLYVIRPRLKLAYYVHKIFGPRKVVF